LTFNNDGAALIIDVTAFDFFAPAPIQTDEMRPGVEALTPMRAALE
jgi:hypothetical protein